MPESLDSDKTSLRQQIRGRLHAMSAERHRADSQQLSERLLTLPVWKRARIVLLFAPLRDEPDILSEVLLAREEANQAHVLAYEFELRGHRSPEGSHTRRIYLSHAGIQKSKAEARDKVAKALEEQLTPEQSSSLK